jgi:hypothetical protein
MGLGLWCNIPLSQSCVFHISWILISGIYISQLILYLYIVVNMKNGHQKHTEYMLRALFGDLKYDQAPNIEECFLCKESIII